MASFGQLAGEQPDRFLIVKEILRKAMPRRDSLIRFIVVFRTRRHMGRCIWQRIVVLSFCARAEEDRSAIDRGDDAEVSRTSHGIFDAVRRFRLGVFTLMPGQPVVENSWKAAETPCTLQRLALGFVRALSMNVSESSSPV